MKLFFYSAVGDFNENASNLLIQLVGEQAVRQFGDSYTVFRDDEISLDKILNNMESEYLISDYKSFNSIKCVEEIFKIIKELTNNQKDSFFIAGVTQNLKNDVLLCYQDIKRYRGKLSGPILHINRSELGKNISIEFYRSLYKKWNFEFSSKRYQSFWRDVGKIILNYNVVLNSNNDNSVLQTM